MPEQARDDDVLAREEAAAAAEAARIGGPAPPDAADPVRQAGGGEQDGWDEAEEDLVENAGHGDGHARPLRDALTPERESDRSTAAYGEADQEIDPDA